MKGELAAGRADRPRRPACRREQQSHVGRLGGVMAGGGLRKRVPFVGKRVVSEETG